MVCKSVLKIVVPAFVALSMIGCASVTKDPSHPIRIETKDQSGKLVTGADCQLTNDYGTVKMKSGATAMVHRSSRDLSIVCNHPSNPEATAFATSRANAGMMGNVIIGGGIGMMIDHSTGAAYTYPTWMQLVFGQSLVFDRRAEKEGSPTPPNPPSAPK